MIRAWRRIWPCVCGETPKLVGVVAMADIRKYSFGALPDYRAQCQGCKRLGPIKETREEALRAWNYEMQLMEQGVRNEEQRARKEGIGLH